MPPIFQPELIADAIVFAAEHRRREIWLAGPAIKAIVSDKVAPRIGDRVLARSGFSGQMTSAKVKPDRPDDLYQPVAGDYGARGEFDALARSFSFAWWLSKHRAALLGGGLALAAGAVLLGRALQA